jgi:NAD(P)-dependent dehydrogenase (short-subunit alcohol dehydrogenase family)
MSEKWTHDDIPDQSDRVALVTGSNTGIGFETAAALAGHGATVILAVRDVGRGASAAERISRSHPDADVSVQRLDLSSLDSVRTAVDQLRSNHPRIDLLVNNAGIAYSPRSRTDDGFERIFGTNHLGHFALTGLLLPSMLEEPGSRVVTVSALAHRQAPGIRFDDLQRAESYSSWKVYGESKLANLLFTHELQRRLADRSTIAVAAHPGLSRSDLSRDAPRVRGMLFRMVESTLLQSTAMGALPSLRAATDPRVRGGEFYGPARRGIRGYPTLDRPSPTAQDPDSAAKLWALSEQLTEVRFPV